jgi:hypothetical protein
MAPFYDCALPRFASIDPPAENEQLFDSESVREMVYNAEQPYEEEED